MSHWQVHAVTWALSLFESAGSGRANITLNAGGSQLGNRELRMLRVRACTSRGPAPQDCALIASGGMPRAAEVAMHHVAAL